MSWETLVLDFLHPEGAQTYESQRMEPTTSVALQPLSPRALALLLPIWCGGTELKVVMLAFALSESLPTHPTLNQETRDATSSHQNPRSTGTGVRIPAPTVA